MAEEIYQEETPPTFDLQALYAQAQELGIQYTGDDPVELHGLVAVELAERGKDVPVPCFGKSYDATDRRCRICQLRDQCADKDKRPRIEVLESVLQSIPCEACGRGVLEVECEDPETGELRDYACTTAGCQNSIAVQCGFESVAAEAPVEIVLGEEAAEETEATEEQPKEEEPVEAEAAEKPKPQLRVVRGGAAATPKKKKVVVKRAAKSTAGKVTKKTAAKKTAAKKTAAKKTAVKKAPAAKKVRKKANAKVAGKKAIKKMVATPGKSRVGQKACKGLSFVMGGQAYNSLTQVVNHITGNNSWSPKKFFALDVSQIQPGDVLERQWQGKAYAVEVQRA